MDVMLPGMNGIELCRKIRKTKQIPLIIISARNNPEDKKVVSR
ncbi:response regulator [Paenibacillus sp. B-A-8]